MLKYLVGKISMHLKATGLEGNLVNIKASPPHISALFGHSNSHP